MALTKKALSEREKSAIYYHVFGGVDDWDLLYMIADDNKLNADKDRKYFHQIVSTWKRSDKVQNFIKELRERQIDQIGEIRQRIREEEKNKLFESIDTNNTPDDPGAKIIDYTNPDSQRRKLNLLINQAKDNDEALDALKVMIQTQKDDKQAAREQKQQRIYLPLSCSSCPLYELSKKNLTI